MCGYLNDELGVRIRWFAVILATSIAFLSRAVIVAILHWRPIPILRSLAHISWWWMSWRIQFVVQVWETAKVAAGTQVALARAHRARIGRADCARRWRHWAWLHCIIIPTSLSWDVDAQWGELWLLQLLRLRLLLLRVASLKRWWWGCGKIQIIQIVVEVDFFGCQLYLGGMNLLMELQLHGDCPGTVVVLAHQRGIGTWAGCWCSGSETHTFLLTRRKYRLLLSGFFFFGGGSCKFTSWATAGGLHPCAGTPRRQRHHSCHCRPCKSVGGQRRPRCGVERWMKSGPYWHQLDLSMNSSLSPAASGALGTQILSLQCGLWPLALDRPRCGSIDDLKTEKNKTLIKASYQHNLHNDNNNKQAPTKLQTVWS